MSDTITVYVKTMAGDLLPVEVSIHSSIAHFADEFVRQHRYHPSSVRRLVFLIQEEDKEEQVFWSPEKSHAGHPTYLSLYPEGLPLLHLFIRPMDESERVDKLELLRSLLRKNGLYSMYDDEELFSLYGTWHLTYLPEGRSNRYLAMKTFIDQHPDRFWIMNKEEEVACTAWYENYQRIAEFRHFIMEQATEVSERLRRYPQFVFHRNRVFPFISSLSTMENNTVRSSIVKELIFYYGFYELLDLGIPSVLLCPCQNRVCFTRDISYWRERVGPIALPPFPPLPSSSSE